MAPGLPDTQEQGRQRGPGSSREPPLSSAAKHRLLPMRCLHSLAPQWRLVQALEAHPFLSPLLPVTWGGGVAKLPGTWDTLSLKSRMEHLGVLPKFLPPL